MNVVDRNNGVRTVLAFIAELSRYSATIAASFLDNLLLF